MARKKATRGMIARLRCQADILEFMGERPITLPMLIGEIADTPNGVLLDAWDALKDQGMICRRGEHFIAGGAS